ncbi:MAG: cation-transporting P-type ATPase, partial [Eudoraea sp.]|nr:cation-transporting P-type ATPase [Eudoraea sp.]
MIQNAFSLSIQDIVKVLQCDTQHGLSNEEVQKRLLRFGPNKIPEKGPKRRILILADQFKDPIIYILWIAFLLAIILGDWPEGIAILVVIAITIGIGYFMELQAVRALEKLRSLG